MGSDKKAMMYSFGIQITCCRKKKKKNDEVLDPLESYLLKGFMNIFKKWHLEIF